MRTTTKLMITRQHHSRSVKKRTAFIIYFSNHATKKTSHLNQERSWGFGGSFFRAGRGRNMRKKGRLFCFLPEMLLTIS